ncbi:hypothetical protein SAMN05444370_101531 [Rubrimonas cliftonensis]|uniref:Ammonia monooxygenase n=2 Tax=Rubrimonas cliftonensis TaxID=89524 RepID=A0A1H3W5F9_9RHOB|nr:hypothetical protein SAMN05444370_101531 [Rubrimonas cliftonensis]
MSSNPQHPLRQRVAQWCFALCLGAIGGVVALNLGAPLPWLLGGLFATGAAAAANVRAFGGPIAFPQTARLVFIPVIGVLIGGAVTAELAAAALGWWHAALGVAVFVCLAHWVNYQVFRRVGGLSRETAFFAGMPGGLIESIELGSKAGADARDLSALQFARIAVTVTLIPLAFMFTEGHAVGSAGGARFAAAGALTLNDFLLLTSAGVVGFFGARAIRLPAGQILGPIVVSGLVHALGWTHAAPPDWLVSVSQLVVGVSLGQRFTGMRPAALGRCFALSLVSVGAMMAVAAVIAAPLAMAGAAPFAIMLIALAPGGVVEMGLIALSLGADPIFVTFCHLVRILVTVAVATTAWRRMNPPG